MNTCPHCNRIAVVVATDEHHDREVLCVSCGWRPAREPDAVESGAAGRRFDPRPSRMGQGQGRGPKHNGQRL